MIKPLRLARAARLCAVFFAAAALLCADNVRLYLKDGNYHMVREYKVEGDRVKFYSVERSQWEEVPLDLVDLKKTADETREREAADKEQTKQIDEEEKAERDLKKEIERVPMEQGVYYLNGAAMQPVKQAESKLVTSKSRKVLQVMSPIPAFAGKAVVELDGEHSKTVIGSAKPEFYIRLSSPERFGIVMLTPHKGNRIVEKVSIIQVSNDKIEERSSIDVYRYQVSEAVYKIWPLKPLEPGEYAVVQFTEGELNVQVWDFSWPGK